MNGSRASVGRKAHGRLGLEMRLLGYLGLVLAGLALCWPDSPVLAVAGIPSWIAAMSLTLCGVMLVRGGNGLREASQASGDGHSAHVSYSRTCFVLASIFLSPMLLCVAVQLVTFRLHG